MAPQTQSFNVTLLSGGAHDSDINGGVLKQSGRRHSCAYATLPAEPSPRVGFHRRRQSLPHSMFSPGLGWSTECKERARNRIIARIGLRISEAAEPIIEQAVLHEGAMLIGHLHRGAESAAHRVVEGSGRHHLHKTLDAHAANREGCIVFLCVRFVVVAVGVLLVLHMVLKDWHRAKREQAQRKPSRAACRFILLALALDAVDLAAHIVMLLDFAPYEIEHDVLERAQHVGFRCACLGTIALVLGEVASGLNRRGSTHAPAVVACMEAEDCISIDG